MNPELLADTLDALHEGVQILSSEFRYLYVNEAAARQGRKPRSELIGKTMVECYPGIDRTPMFALLQRCLAEKRADVMENEFTYENGKRAWFELRIRPCPAGLVLVSLDTTARKSVESSLKEAYGQALRDLVTPVIPLYHGVLLVPLVGALTSDRAARITETVLTRTEDGGAKVVIFDVSGIPDLDTAVAQHLLQTIAMIRLLGATTILTGVAASTAKALVRLGIDLTTTETTSHLAQGIELALARIGRAVVSRG